MRTLLLLIPVLLPGPLKRAWYRHLLGWRIGRRVRIGLSYLDAKAVEIGDDVYIGHLNLMRWVDRFAVGPGTHIANLNTFSGNHYPGPGWARTLEIGAKVYVMSRHLFDVAGTISVGDGATIAGRDTHLWTHTLRADADPPALAPVALRIGAGCYVGARSTLLYCTLPDGCVVGAGSVVARSFPPAGGERLLIAGNPATVRKTYPLREAGAVARG